MARHATLAAISLYILVALRPSATVPQVNPGSLMVAIFMLLVLFCLSAVIARRPHPVSAVDAILAPRPAKAAKDAETRCRAA